MESPFAIYSPVKWNRDQQNACTYYRVEVPFRGISELGSETFIDDGGWDEEEVSLPAMLSADILLWYALSGDGCENIQEEIQKMKPGFDGAGRIRYPPSTVFDIDDNLDYVHPFNQTFARFGTRGIDGKKLIPGDTLSVNLPDGQKVPLWVDKESRGFKQELFDIARNHAFINRTHSMVTLVNGCTFTTEALGEWYKENWGLEDYYVFPNSVVPQDYPEVDLAPRDDVRLLWQGGASHAPDWAPLREAVKHLANKYPQTKWIFWGSRDNWAEGDIPDKQRIIKDWIHYRAYKPWRSIIDADINLCPLLDNNFNRFKSAIKWYEGALQEEATVAANVGPFREIEDGKTGMLYDTPEEFITKVGALIENVEFRKKIGAAGKQWVLDNRHYRKTIPGLLDYYKELRERKVAEFRDPKVLVEVGGNGRDTNIS